MGVHCLTGRRGSGKTTRCVETIRKLLGTGAPILFLVPEQDTVEAEMHLAGALNLSVFWNLEVLSLKRLAQRIGQSAGGGAQVTLSDAGRAMALKGAMIGLRGGMKYYRSGASGAADLMGDLMVELRRGESDATQLRLAADKLPPEGALAQKLYDLAAVYEEYDGRIAGKYQDGEDALRRSAQLCGQCGELKDAYVFADGFDVLPRTALTVLTSDCCISCRPAASWPISLRPVIATFCVRSPLAMVRIWFMMALSGLRSRCCKPCQITTSTAITVRKIAASVHCIWVKLFWFSSAAALSSTLFSARQRVQTASISSCACWASRSP